MQDNSILHQELHKDEGIHSSKRLGGKLQTYIEFVEQQLGKDMQTQPLPSQRSFVKADYFSVSIQATNIPDTYLSVMLLLYSSCSNFYGNASCILYIQISKVQL